MKTESLNWQKKRKICNGIMDFGLLREEQTIASDETLQKKNSVCVSRLILIIGVVAAITFVICLVLANRYQKSVTLSHHYASFISEKSRKNYDDISKHTMYGDNNYDENKQKEFNTSVFNKLQNFSDKLPSVEEINFLLPVTTVLHPLNTSRNDRHLKFSNLSIEGTTSSFLKFQNYETVATEKKQLSLADLLKRIELKPLPNTTFTNDETYRTTVTKSTVHFAQLGSYEHPRSTKNLQGIIKYLRCHSIGSCDFMNETVKEEIAANDMRNPITHTNYGYDQDANSQKNLQNITATTGILSNVKPNSSWPSGKISRSHNVSYSDASAVPPRHSFSFSDDHKNQILGLDRFYDYKVFNPLDINQLEPDQTIIPTTATSKQAVHRFSNRMYHNSGESLEDNFVHKNIDDSRTQVLESFLKPPTLSPPTILSFTPSHTTALFHELDQFSVPAHDSKLEAATSETMAQMKPITLMVEILPANDYELPGSSARDKIDMQFTRQKQSFSDSDQIGLPLFTPWRLPRISQNSLRLLVNLFPQRYHFNNDVAKSIR